MVEIKLTCDRCGKTASVEATMSKSVYDPEESNLRGLACFKSVNTCTADDVMDFGWHMHRYFDWNVSLCTDCEEYLQTELKGYNELIRLAEDGRRDARNEFMDSLVKRLSDRKSCEQVGMIEGECC